jgi:hypothetical protein
MESANTKRSKEVLQLSRSASYCAQPKLSFFRKLMGHDRFCFTRKESISSIPWEAAIHQRYCSNKRRIQVWINVDHADWNVGEGGGIQTWRLTISRESVVKANKWWSTISRNTEAHRKALWAKGRRGLRMTNPWLRQEQHQGLCVLFTF